MSQKWVIRIVNRTGYDAHTVLMFKELDLIFKMHSFQLGQYMYSISSDNLPSIFNFYSFFNKWAIQYIKAGINVSFCLCM